MEFEQRNEQLADLLAQSLLRANRNMDDPDFRAAFGFLTLLHVEATSDTYKEEQKLLCESLSQMPIARSSALWYNVNPPPITFENQQVDLDWPRVLQELSLHTRVRVDVSPGKGRGLFAARDFKKGELILMEKPLLAASVDENACYHCLKISTQLKHVCQACKVACCSADCLELMKKYHICCKSWHKAIKRVQAANSSSPLCLLLMAKFYGYLQNAESNSDHIKKVNSLSLPPDRPNSRSSFFSDNNRWDIFRKAIGNPQFTDFRWYKEVERRVMVNSFSLSHRNDKWLKLQGNATALYLVASMPNHSCRPNAKTEFDQEHLGAAIKFVAKRRIKKGEEITLSYFELSDNMDVEQRGRKLYNYNFVCICDRCKMERGDK